MRQSRDASMALSPGSALRPVRRNEHSSSGLMGFCSFQYNMRIVLFTACHRGFLCDKVGGPSKSSAISSPWPFSLTSSSLSLSPIVQLHTLHDFFFWTHSFFWITPKSFARHLFDSYWGSSFACSCFHPPLCHISTAAGRPRHCFSSWSFVLYGNSAFYFSSLSQVREGRAWVRPVSFTARILSQWKVLKLHQAASPSALRYRCSLIVAALTWLASVMMKTNYKQVLSLLAYRARF